MNFIQEQTNWYNQKDKAIKETIKADKKSQPKIWKL